MNYEKLWIYIVVLGFTRTVSSIWAMTLLSLYVRVQVTILGRHLYLDFARVTDGAQLQVIFTLHVLFSVISTI